MCNELQVCRSNLQGAEKISARIRSQLDDVTDELKRTRINSECIKNEHQQTMGSYYALKYSHLYLENKVEKLENSKLKSDRELESTKKILDSLLVENDELKERSKKNKINLDEILICDTIQNRGMRKKFL